MMAHWILVIFLTVLLSGLLKGCIAEDLKDIVIPVEIAEVTSVMASPNNHAASDIQISLRSAYAVEVHLRLDDIPIVFNDDGSVIKARKFRQGDSHMILIASAKPMNTSLLGIGLLTQHPRNTVAVWLYFDALRDMFEKGVSFPVVTEMPKRGYRVEKDDSVVLKYSVTYEGSGGLVAHNASAIGYFSQPFHWHEDNIIRGTMHPGDEERFEQYKPKFDERQHSSTSPSGYITLTAELEERLGDSFPMDGSVLYVEFTFKVGPESPQQKNRIYVYVYTSLHYTDTDDIPMGVEQLSWNLNTFSLGYQKKGSFNMLIVGLNYETPAESRGLKCIAVGLENAPVIAVAELPSLSNVIGDVTKLKQVDLLLPGSHFGPMAFEEFKIDLPLGSEAYYVLSASTANKVTTTVIKVISIIPVKVNIEENREKKERYEATCTATGSPKPTMRIFLVPEANVTYNGAYIDAAKVQQEYEQFELMDQSGKLNVSTSSRTTAEKTVSFFWEEFLQEGHDSDGFTLWCIASNLHQRELATNEIWYFNDDVYNSSDYDMYIDYYSSST
ncbi:uncharacterized protein LOC135489645 [Lineus longissimus]|uniref:uncharacterized protein LOC135489645 n=1 Tax=Lineus longissimus TaxID=88925 RepID=UPI002B4CC93E